MIGTPFTGSTKHPPFRSGSGSTRQVRPGAAGPTSGCVGHRVPTACLQEFGADVFRGNRRAGERSSCATARETADMSTTLTEDHRGAFEALTRGEAGNFCLVSW